MPWDSASLENVKNRITESIYGKSVDVLHAPGLGTNYTLENVHAAPNTITKVKRCEGLIERGAIIPTLS